MVSGASSSRRSRMEPDRLCAPVDTVEGLAEVVAERVGGGDDVGPAWISMVR